MNEKTNERSTIVRGGKCGCRGKQSDAVEHYQRRIVELCEEIQREKDQRMSYNSGVGFVTFVSRLQVSRCLDKKDYHDLAMAHLSIDDRVKWNAHRWIVSKAPSQTEILWENFFKNEKRSRIKSWLLLGLLLFVCVVLVTPLLLVQKLTPLLKAAEDSVGEYPFLILLLQIAQEHLASLMTLVFNQAIIPQAVAIISTLDDHKSKAQRQLSVMNRNYFFQTVITIFLQLSVQVSILAFINYLAKADMGTWPEMLGKNLVDNGFVFLRYTIQAAFFSNGILLLDVGHMFVRWFKRILHKRAQKEVLHPKPFVDDEEFDLGER